MRAARDLERRLRDVWGVGDGGSRENEAGTMGTKSGKPSTQTTADLLPDGWPASSGCIVYLVGSPQGVMLKRSSPHCRRGTGGPKAGGPGAGAPVCWPVHPWVGKLRPLS